MIPKGWDIWKDHEGQIRIDAPHNRHMMISHTDRSNDPTLDLVASLCEQILNTSVQPTQDQFNDIPVGSTWTHSNGYVYRVIAIANHPSGDPLRYPASVVYQGENGRIWTRPMSEWHRSMSPWGDTSDGTWVSRVQQRILGDVACAITEVRAKRMRVDIMQGFIDKRPPTPDEVHALLLLCGAEAQISGAYTTGERTPKEVKELSGYDRFVRRERTQPDEEGTIPCSE